MLKDSFAIKNHGDGKDRCDLNLEMDGVSVFVFSISHALKAFTALATNYEIDLNTIDFFIFHHANLFMIGKIRNKLKIDAGIVSYSPQGFGNTSCASILLGELAYCVTRKLLILLAVSVHLMRQTI